MIISANKFSKTALSLAISSALFSNNLAANEYDATANGITTQAGLFNEIITGALKPSNYDTIVFKGPGSFEVFEDIQGGEPPYTNSGTLGVDALFQNIRSEGASTSDTFLFLGGQTGSCSPCTPKAFRVSTNSLSIDNIAWSMEPRKTTFDYIEDFIIYNRGNTTGQLNLNNGHLKLDQSFGSGSQLTFGRDISTGAPALGAMEINVTGKDNKIIAPGGAIARSLVETKMHLHTGSALEISGTTELNMRDFGYLKMDSGSSLDIIDSKVVLTRESTAATSNSMIEGGSVNVSGSFGSDPSSLVLSNPTFKDSSITLGLNTRLASSTKANGILQASNFYFEGNNTITLAKSSALTGFKDEDTDIQTGFYFKDGRTQIDGVLDGALSSSVNAQAINLNNADLFYKDINLQDNLSFVKLENGSSLSHGKVNGESLENLTRIDVSNSTIASDFDFGLSAITNSVFTNATIKQIDTRLTRANTFYLNGINGGPTTKATVSFSGSNTIESRIDPLGKDIGIPAGIVTGSKIYADGVYFVRNGVFTDEASSVNGLGNVTVELSAFAQGLSADDYATGGENNDGEYDILFFTRKDNTMTDATADSDVVAVKLGLDMPALLQATQVATPSGNQKVAYKLEKVASTEVASTLTSKPNVTTANQTGSANLVANAYQNGNSTVQTALNTLTNAQAATSLDTVHAEPYSSFMTVSLEHADLMLNTLLGQATTNGTFESNISTLNMQAAPSSSSKTLDNTLAMGQTRSGRSWGDASYIKGKVEGEDGLGTYKYSVGSITFGHDLLTTKRSNVGAYFSLGDQSMDEHDKAEQTFESTAVHIGAYGSLNLDSDWELRGVWGAGFSDNETQRTVVVGNVVETPKADFDSYSTYLGASLGKTLYKNEYVALRPEVGANYVYYKQEAIEESGASGFELNIDSASAQSLVSNLALKARFKELGDYQIAPLAFVRYEFDLHAAKDSAHDIDAALGGAPGYKQEFSGKNRGKHALSTGLGFDAPLNSNLQMGGGFAYSFNSHGYEWGAGVNLAYFW